MKKGVKAITQLMGRIPRLSSEMHPVTENDLAITAI